MQSMGGHTEIWELAFPSSVSLACTGPGLHPCIALGWLRDSCACGVEKSVNFIVENLLSNNKFLSCPSMSLFFDAVNFYISFGFFCI